MLHLNNYYVCVLTLYDFLISQSSYCHRSESPKVKLLLHQQKSYFYVHICVCNIIIIIVTVQNLILCNNDFVQFILFILTVSFGALLSQTLPCLCHHLFPL